jgi:hypothetical protein
MATVKRGKEHIRHNGLDHQDVLVWPHVDLDYTVTYDLSGNISTIEIVGLGYTKTLTMTYDGSNNLLTITTVIT